MSRFIVIILTASLVFLSFLLSKPDSNTEAVRIGLALCLSGECAHWGENSLKGAQLAVREINQAGGLLGRPVEIRLEDTAESSSARQAVAAFQSILLDRKTTFVIGPNWTPAAMALAPIVGKKEVVVVSPSAGVSAFNESSDNIFNTWPHDSVATKALAKFAWDRDWKRAAIISSEQPWEKLQGDTFADAFTALGGEVRGRIRFSPHEREQRSPLARLLQEDIDFVVFSNFQTMDTSARILAELSYRGPLLAVLMDEVRIKNAQGALETCIYARYREADRDFVSRYKQAFGETPGISSDTSYDAVMSLARAITNAESLNTSRVKEELVTLEFQGASGSIVFDKLGGVKKTPILYVVEDGRGRPL